MKIAVITDDANTISAHFGRAHHFLVFTLKDGVIANRELRDKAGHDNFAGHNHEFNQDDQDDHDHHDHHNHRHEGRDEPRGRRIVALQLGADCGTRDARTCRTGARSSFPLHGFHWPWLHAPLDAA